MSRAFPRDAGGYAKVSWTSPAETTRAWVDALAEDVASLQAKFDALLAARDACDASLKTLEASDGSEDLVPLAPPHRSIQEVVDRLSLEGFHDLAGWTERLDGRCVAALQKRCADRLRRWAAAVEGSSVDGAEPRDGGVDAGCRRSLHRVGATASGLALEPGVETARVAFHAQRGVGAARRRARLRALSKKERPSGRRT